MKSKLFLILIPIIILSLPCLELYQTTNQNNKIELRCPPCGCNMDHKVFTDIDVCPTCKMKLVEVNHGVNAKIDKHISWIFMTNILGKLYDKLIYPIFVLGIIISLLLIFRNPKTEAINTYFFLIILIIGLYAFKNQLFGVKNGLSSSYKSIFTPISFITALGPLIYFYIQKILSPQFRVNQKNIYHFLPVVAFFFYYLVLLCSSDVTQSAYMISPFEVRFSHFEQLLTSLGGLIYICLSWRYISRHKKKYPLTDKDIYNWALQFLYGMSLVFMCWLSLISINYFLYDLGVATVSYNLLNISFFLVLVFFFLSIFRKPKFFLALKKHNPNSKSGSRLTEQEIETYISRLNDTMEKDKLYLNINLTIDDLAKSLNTNSKYLSLILNRHLKKKFYEYINEYRIEEAKKLLLDPSKNNLTIEAISKLSGFKSKSTFNSTFKKLNGITPKTFIREKQSNSK
ncbi:helix-turn-helix domain-containing protein [Winogradskyella sp. 3972H.M.0a.05]|uniref:helix-turn-helix domain-containing protein n=1 Tax=Winogradskyella sp. 3972H.M.0a.05 TaxID=2950277 RepID=UPI00339A1CD3